MGGKANVTVGGELAAQLGIAGTTTTPGGIGLAREKPQGSWLLLSRFEPGAGRGGGMRGLVVAVRMVHMLGVLMQQMTTLLRCPALPQPSP